MSPKNVLVVDDDWSILRLVATILKREQYAVDTALGGREGLAKIAANVYDVIVLDLMMPDVSGLDVLQALNTRLPQVKCVIIMSAASSLQIASSMNPCVFSALRKPFDNVDLISAVRECVVANGPATPALPAAA